MKKYVLLFGIVLIAFILSSTTTKNEKSGEKIMVSHITSSDNLNVKENIEIDINKLQAHLDHGDTIVK